MINQNDIDWIKQNRIEISQGRQTSIQLIIETQWNKSKYQDTFSNKLNVTVLTDAVVKQIKDKSENEIGKIIEQDKNHLYIVMNDNKEFLNESGKNILLLLTGLDYSTGKPNDYNEKLSKIIYNQKDYELIELYVSGIGSSKNKTTLLVKEI